MILDLGALLQWVYDIAIYKYKPITLQQKSNEKKWQFQVENEKFESDIIKQFLGFNLTRM